MAKTDKKSPEIIEDVVTALSLIRVPSGWAVATYKIQGDKVLSVERTEVNVKAIAMETFKMKAVKELLNK